MRIKHTVNLFISEDAEGTEGLFGQSAASTQEVTIDNMGTPISGKFSIAGGGVEDLPLGDIDDIRALFVKAKGDFDVQFNGSSDKLQIRRARAATGVTAKMFLEGVFTEVKITNDSATDILTGIFALYGDPT